MDKRNVEDIMPLTPVQEGLLYHHLSSPGEEAYHEQLALALAGDINADDMRAAWEHVVQSNQLLRATYRWKKIDHPVQIILKQIDVPFALVDLSAQEDKEQAFDTFLSEDRKTGFDLESTPYRMSLIRLAGGGEHLVLSNHHILFDGWSTGIILKELVAAYRLIHAGKELPVTHKPSFKGHLAYLSKLNKKAQETFWRKYLGDFEPNNLLKKQYPDAGSYGTETLTMPQAQLSAAAVAREMSPATLIYAAWAWALAKATGNIDQVIGITLSGRNNGIPGTESIVGPYLNTLPFRIQHSKDTTLNEQLLACQRNFIEWSSHEHSNLREVISWSGQASADALFDNLVIVENYPLDNTLTQLRDGLAISNYRMVEQTHYDLTLTVTLHHEISFQLSYNKGSYSEATACTIAQYFHEAISAITTTAGTEQIGSFTLLPETTNPEAITGEVLPVSGTLTDLWVAVAQEQGEKAALITHDIQLSYKQLDEQTDAWAALLLDRGLEPGEIVGVCASRGSEMIVALLAILKAGGAYLPLDPEYPQDRINFMLSDSHCRIVLSDASHKARFDWPEKVDLIEISASIPEKKPLAIGHDSRTLAYMIYTSGSTGLPKGVMVEHAQVVNFIEGMQQIIGFDKPLLSLTTISFDIFVLEAWGTLFSGETLILGNEDAQTQPSVLADWLTRHQPGMLQMTPSRLKMLGHFDPEYKSLSSVQKLMVGGEPFPQDLLDTLQKYYSGRIFNMYGPTETTVWSAVKELTQAKEITLGTAILNTQLYVLDSFGQVQAKGMPGELWIGGEGVTRGYWEREELTNTRFLPNTFSGTGRIYGTGDLVRINEQSELEYLGRLDQQIKVRGYRIETGEIENAIMQVNGIREVKVLAPKNPQGDAYLVAYLSADRDVTVDDLQNSLGDQLPEYMIPVRVVQLDKLPQTPNGKTDVKALGAISLNASAAETEQPADEWEERVSKVWEEILKTSDIGVDQKYFEVGGNSLNIIGLAGKLQKEFGKEIAVPTLFAYPTIRSQAAFFSGKKQETSTAARRKAKTATSNAAIAIVGMSGSFPGAVDLEQFWQNLSQGKESLQLSESKKGLDIAAKGRLERAPYFDHEFFQYAPAEAAQMDPQVAVLHEVTWEALQDAGYNPFLYDGEIGIYVGASANPYSDLKLFQNKGDNFTEYWEGVQYADKDFIGTRLAYQLNLKGPAITVNTACSTSLVAVDMAARALRDGQCHMALAGASSITWHDDEGYNHQEGMILSPDGHCRAFDEQAAGTVSGNGAGIVVLKLLEDAIADGDQIHAVIKGSGVSNDGQEKVAFSAPGVNGQVRAITAALEQAEVAPESISYVEAHGTGTVLGDPIEIESLRLAYGSHKQKTTAIGSVKTNIGHLDTAAGIAGLIKTVLALKNKQLPASLNFTRPNPKINFEDSPFYVVSDLKAWKSEGPRRAGISSFGIGGTNAHIILEEHLSAKAENKITPDTASGIVILPLNSQQKGGIKRQAERLASYLESNPEAKLADVAYTLQHKRAALKWQSAVAAETLSDAITGLRSQGASAISQVTKQQEVCLMFPGQGAQYVGMTQGLYASDATYRKHLDVCLQLAGQHLDVEASEILFGEDQKKINQTVYTQPLLFAVEYALAKTLMERGLKVQSMIGHSIGEWVAAAIGGVMSLQDAMRMVCLRGRYMQEMEPGSMLAIAAAAEALGILPGGITIAAVNSSQRVVVAGEKKQIEQYQQELQEKGLAASILKTSHAFHSAMMEQAAVQLEESMKEVTLQAPQVPFISNVSGTWITREEACSPAYWANQLRKPVAFAQGISQLAKGKDICLVECGPGKALSTFAVETLGLNASPVQTIRHPKEQMADHLYLEQNLAMLVLTGRSKVKVAGLDVKGSHIYLPPYAFAKNSLWELPDLSKASATTGQQYSRALRMFSPSWERVKAAVVKGNPGQVLLFNTGGEQGKQLATALRSYCTELIEVCRTGEGEGAYKTDADERSINQLIATLAGRDKLPATIIYAWGLGGYPVTGADSSTLFHEEVFLPLLSLTRAIATVDGEKARTLNILSNHLCDVSGMEEINPIQAPLLAFARTLSGEYGHWTTCLIDTDAYSVSKPVSANRIAGITLAKQEETQIALRGAYAWKEKLNAQEISTEGNGDLALQTGGTYLITGGFGAIGKKLAITLASDHKVNIILTSRSAGQSQDQTDFLAELEALGAKATLFAADISKEEDVKALFAHSNEVFGKVDGIFHAAGMADGALISNRENDSYAPVMAAKVQGTWHLYQHLIRESADFMILFGSVNTYTAPIGQLAYTAANSFQHAFAIFAKQQGQSHVKTINWDAWRGLGMSRHSEELAASAGITLAGGMDSEEAMSKLSLIMQSEEVQPLIATWNPLLPVPNSTEPESKDISVVTMAEDLPGAMLSLWKQFFGISSIGLDDSFFELGGDSLKAVLIMGRMEKELGVKISLEDLFEKPTIRQLTARISKTSEGTNEIAAIPLREYYPLTRMQERMYVLQQLDATSIAYNISHVLRVTGKLDEERLQKAIDKLIQRHEPLRTGFYLVDGQPVQKVYDTAAVVLQKKSCSTKGVQECIHSIIRPFDLSGHGLIRFTLLQSPAGQLLVLDTHHIVADGFSMEVLIRDLTSYYMGKDLVPLDWRYVDFVAWQNIQSQQEQKRSFWEEQLASERPVPELPCDYARPEVQDFAGEVIRFTLSEELRQQVTAIAREESATPYMVLLTIFHSFLSRLSLEDDLTIGTPMANRKVEGSKDHIGLFVNTLPLRINAASKDTLRERLRITRQAVLRSFEHADYPVETLIKSQSGSRHPLYDTLFVLQNLERNEISIGDATVETFSYDNAIAKADLSLQVIEEQEGYTCIFEYATALFSASTARRFAQYIETIANQSLSSPDEAVHSIDLISKEEKAQLTAWNATTHDFGAGTFVSLFEEKVKSTPAATALSAGTEECNYEVLNASANQLANALISTGLNKGDHVAVLLPRSIELSTAFVAVLKAGAVLVPVDPEYPTERIRYILEDAAPARLITTSKLLPESFKGNTFLLDQQDMKSQDTQNPAIVIAPEDVAYMIYTSGTSGKPKGSQIAHNSLYNLCLSHQLLFDVTPADRAMVYAGVGFDASVWEQFPYLAVGASLHVIAEEDRLDMERLAAFIARKEISICFLTTQLGEQYMQFGAENALRILLVGGEDLHRFSKQPYQVYNCYGPTENTVISTVGLLTGDTREISIGGPIHNHRSYVVHPVTRQLQPQGSPGELLLAGVGLSTGYWNRPELSAEKFIAAPLLEEVRVYCTGDLVRQNAQGKLLFMGRTDTQVKIRGYRVEVSEIENQIKEVLGTPEVLVHVWDSPSGEKVLCTYVVGKSEAELENARTVLTDRLAAYMIPRHWKTLSQMPLTTNGKIDRKALPQPDWDQRSSHYMAPSTSTETILQECYAQVLEKEQSNITTNESFFELGGHSLKATKLLTLIRERMNTTISLRDFYANSSIRQLARLITQDGASAVISPMQQAPQQAAYPVTASQLRMIMMQEMQPEATDYNMPLAVEIKGKVDPQQIEALINTLVQRHEVLRTSFHEQDQQWVQRIADNVTIRLEQVNATSADMEATLRGLVQPFALDAAPLMRASLVEAFAERQILLLDLHHIIADGTSVQLITSELMSLLKGEDLEMPSLQFKDLAWHLDQPAAKESLAVQEKWWLKEFEELPEQIALPADTEAPVSATGGEILHVEFPATLANDLRQKGSQWSTGAFVPAMVGYQILLSRLLNTEDITMGTVTNGRTLPSTQSMLGMMVQTLALRQKITARDTVQELITRVHDKWLEALDHQDYPFDQLVEKLGLGGTHERNPLFETLFVNQPSQLSGMKVKDLEVATYPFHNGTAKFDMTWQFSKGAEKIGLTIEYRADKFRKETITRWVEYYFRILTQVLSQPEKRVDGIKLIDTAERKHLDTFNPKYEAGLKGYVHEHIVATVNRFPARTAVVDQDIVLSYEKLNQLSNGLADQLIEAGLEQGAMVGVEMKRSASLVVAAIAILKAGAVYLPIDPDYPADRKQYMLEDSGAEICLYDNQTAPMGEVWIVDEAAIIPKVAMEHKVTPSEIAYCIYTSGTTGRPKGTLVEHHALLNLCSWHNSAFQLTEKDVCTLFAGVGFDASVWELFPALVAGASLHCINGDLRIDTSKLNEYYSQHGITVTFLPTQVAEQFLQEGNKTLRYLLTGGDKLRVFKENTFTLINNYGPTENAVVATSGVVSGMMHNIPIGKPIANNNIFITDRSGKQLQPIGVPGELCITGDSLALGYLNQPELTAERFIACPFRTGKRMYRTGDQARWLPSGEIEFLGRLDTQLKLRGFRIETGEIERVAMETTYVTGAVVTVHGEGDEKQLVLYVSGEEVDVAKVCARLAANLPAYMVPQYVEVLDHMPLTANGKVDKRALPEPQLADKDVEAVTTGHEMLLRDVWAQILSISPEQIGRKSHFFELGGHSLKASFLAKAIHREAGVKVGLKEIFERPLLQEQAKLLSREANGGFEEAVTPASQQEYYPLSSAQQRLYFLQQMDVEATAYNISGAFKMYGSVDLAKLETLLNELVARHESFRTAFVSVDDKAVQTILEEANIKLLTADMRAEVLPEQAAAHFLRDFVKPFDLEQAPLLRAACVQLSEEEFLLALDTHHIVADGASLSVFVEELCTRYEGGTLEQPGLQYKDYAVWENKPVIRQQLADMGSYWLEQFAGQIPELVLFADYPRPATKSFEGDRVSIRITEEEGKDIRAMATREGVTLFNLLLTVYYVFLHKYSKQEDIVVGVPVSGREHYQLDQTIGNFVNTIALRKGINPSDSFKSLLQAVGELSVNSFEHQSYPYEELVNKLNLKRDLGRNPLFDVMFVMEDVDYDQFVWNGQQMDIFPLQHIIAKFDLNFIVSEIGDELLLNLEFCTRLFKKSTAERFLQSYVHLLRSVLTTADQVVADLSIITPEEKQRLIYDYNATDLPWDGDLLMHQLFEQQVERTPDQIAVTNGADTITYAALNEMSNKVAHQLRSQGLQTEEFVGVVIDRSIEMVAALMGILKAGGVYVPMEPFLPDNRIAKIFSNLEVKQVLSNRNNFFKMLSILQDAPCVQYLGLLDTDDSIATDDVNVWSRAEMDDMSSGNPEPVTNSQHMAYVIYTSGSTGTPKGVVVKHEPVINLIQWVNKTYSVGTQDKILCVASISFDLSVYDIFGGLAAGATLRMASRELIQNAEELTSLLYDEGITFWDSAPPALQQLQPFFMHHEADRAKSKLRLVFMSGDWIPVPLPDQLKEAFPGVKVISLGGATEATIWSNFYPIEKVEPHWVSIPYGKPIQNARYYILDENLSPCPTNIPGDLYISGPVLANGYIQDEELTNSKFIPNPYVKGERMYKTGDLARWWEDGNMEFLGRSDFQVKIRGYRIEMGEITARLLEHPAIKEATVTALSDASGTKYLCAYYIPGATVDQEAIREFLLEELPAYMIPSHFVEMEVFPVNANGKLDRKALPEPQVTTSEKVVALQGGIEEKVAGLWSGILGVEQSQIGRDTDFFELGGHSLNVASLVSQLQKEFAVRVPIVEIFRDPSVAGIARFVENNATEAQVETSRIEQAPEMDSYPLAPVQERLYILQRMNPGSIDYNMPVVYEAWGVADLDKLQACFNTLLARHESLRYRFFEEDEQPRFRINDEDEVTIEELSPEQVESPVEAIGQLIRPFDLANGPLIRMGVVHLSEEHHLLVVDMHHIITDGISTGIFIEELIRLYKEEALPEQEIRYRDYAWWQNSLDRAAQLEAEENYWLEQFAGEVPELQLPVDFGRKANNEDMLGGNHAFALTAEQTETIRQLTLDAGATVFTTLLACYNVFLSKLAHQEDIVVGIPNSGRGQQELDQVLGMFINTLAIRNKPTAEMSFREFLDQVKTQTVAAFDHQHYPYHKLVDKLQISRKPGRNPLFDVSFLFQNYEFVKIELPGMELQEYEHQQSASKFDLKLQGYEKEGILTFRFEYKRSLFKPETIEGFAEHFVQLIAEMTSKPEQALGEFRLSAESEANSFGFDELLDLETE